MQLKPRQRGVQVKKFNGVEVENLRHLGQLTAACTDRFMRFDLDYDVSHFPPHGCKAVVTPCLRGNALQGMWARGLISARISCFGTLGP